jgi:CBS domain containing-hemolysin-like protein
MLAADASRKIRDVEKDAIQWNHSRIPLYEGQVENLVGLVLRREVVSVLVQEQDLDRPLKALAKPIHLVPESITVDRLLSEFLKQKCHLFGVVDEYGEVVGVVSLEDVIETLLGTEILDEADSVADMQELARRKWRERVAQRHGPVHGGMGPTTN